jgi:hypothetical protein
MFVLAQHVKPAVRAQFMSPSTPLRVHVEALSSGTHGVLLSGGSKRRKSVQRVHGKC